MSNLLRCDCCEGRKRIKGLGSIEKDCPACRGIGWIENEDLELQKVLKETMEMPEIKKKRGRKPKPENVVQC